MIQFKKEILTDMKLAVYCETKEQMHNLLIWADFMGKKWVNGESYLNLSMSSNRAFCISWGTQELEGYYERIGFTVLSYDEAMEVPENVVKEKTITYRDLLENYLDTVNAFCEKIGNEDTNYIEDIIGNTNIEEIFNSVEQGTPWNCIASTDDIKENEIAMNCRIQDLAIETINELKADIVQPIGELMVNECGLQLRVLDTLAEEAVYIITKGSVLVHVCISGIQDAFQLFTDSL